jgi:hypothetical protein
MKLKKSAERVGKAVCDRARELAFALAEVENPPLAPAVGGLQVQCFLGVEVKATFESSIKGAVALAPLWSLTA